MVIRTVGSTPFRQLRLVRRRAAFELFEAEASDGTLRIVVTPTEGADPEAARGCLRELARVHGQTPNPFFAVLAEHDATFVAFHGSLLADGEHLFERLAQTHQKLAFSEATGFVRALATALVDLHDTVDRDRPLTLDRVCWGNFVFTRDGEPRYLGLGHNVAALNEHGLPSGAPGVFVAPEVAAGQPATPGADAHACVAMFRSMFPYVELPSPLLGAFQGRATGPLGRLVSWGNEMIFAAAPALRPSLSTALAAFERTWALLRIEPDLAAFQARVRELLEPAEPAAILEVAPDASTFALNGGDAHSLERRKAQRRILAGLVAAHRAGPEPITTDDLLTLGWPGERLVHEAGHNRVHVALSALRKLALREVLQRYEDGYRIDPAVHVRER